MFTHMHTQQYRVNAYIQPHILITCTYMMPYSGNTSCREQEVNRGAERMRVGEKGGSRTEDNMGD